MEDIDKDQEPDFIYGGPFIRRPTPAPLIDTATPRNVQLQAIWTRSFAYHTMRERLPIIITKVIDYLSRSQDTISAQYGATSGEIKQAVQFCAKLKNDIVTNKQLEFLEPNTNEAERWNAWIQAENQPYYFTAVWVFSECYIYRRLHDAFAYNEHLKNFDPFQVQKQEALIQNVAAMCSVATRLAEMTQADNIKENLATLLKVALWANKCDLSLSAGEGLDSVTDPMQAVAAWKDKVLVDDSGKIADFIVEKSAALAKKIEETNFATMTCSCNRLAVASGLRTAEQNVTWAIEDPDAEAESPEQPEEEEVPPPCPAKMTVPTCVMLDIICDNSGYELFTDLCIGHFLLEKDIVQKVRFHVKRIPWFVSDVTPADFKYVIDSCAAGNFPASAFAEKDEPVDPGNLKLVGERWQEYLQDGRFQLESEDFWTSPHVYRDMKKHDPALYRKLQFAVCALFKGDLNYRKLMGETNWTPTTSFEQALQGFQPAPVVAIRTVKAEIIAGLPKGKYEQMQALDDRWMVTGEYGVIQFCPKKEDLKPSDKPCPEFDTTCTGRTCV